MQCRQNGIRITPKASTAKVVVFNAIGGVLLYTMEDKEKLKEAKILDIDDGDDAFGFARPARLDSEGGPQKAVLRSHNAWFTNACAC
jgi:hypothetical protein